MSKQPKNIYHRDGTVTFWAVYEQVWARMRADEIDDKALATMTGAERDRLAKHAARHAE